LQLGFSGFVGIDWSGAKKQFIAGIQLAMAGPDTASPQTIAPPQQALVAAKCA
jgi:hypothetical protein